MLQETTVRETKSIGRQAALRGAAPGMVITWWQGSHTWGGLRATVVSTLQHRISASRD